MRAYSQKAGDQKEKYSIMRDSLIYEDERHIGTIRQLIFGGDNAEVYRSADNSMLVFQSTSERFGPSRCPFFHPSGQKIIFASNHKTERGFPFNLYVINVDGAGLEHVTHDDTFDAFSIFSRDGKHLVFSSSRNNGGIHDTNLFVVDWIE